MQLRYKMVERVLLNMYEVDDRNRKAFTARLNNFRRLGIPEGVNIGKGKVAEYRAKQMYQLVLALEFSEFGMVPATISRLITGMFWRTYAEHFREIEKAPSKRRFLMFEPSLMREATGTVWTSIKFVTVEEVYPELQLKSGVHNCRHVLLDLTAVVQRLNQAIETETEVG